MVTFIAFIDYTFFMLVAELVYKHSMANWHKERSVA